MPAKERCGPFDFTEVKAALQRAVTNRTVTGAALAVVRAGCPPLLVHAVGDQQADSVIELASSSKVPAATVLVALADAGKLSLDDRVGKHLDYWPADKAAITIRHLLSHTSGLPGNVPCIGDAAATLDACARAIAGVRVNAAPGAQFLYGGASFQVAARVAEVAGGKPFNELVRALVTGPCQAPTLSFAASPDNRLGSDTNPRAAGGAASNVRDYGRFLEMHLAGGVCATGARVLSAASVAEMQKDQTGAATIANSPYDDGRKYGLGWWREPPAMAGAPVTRVSDQGAFGATPWIDNAKGYGAVLLVQRSLQAGTAVYRAILPLIEAALAR